MSVTTAADTNPDSRKRASPVLVRIYALKSSAAFDSADFFSLFDKDTATLGADLVQKEEFLMTPGQQKTLPIAKFEPEVKVIAVMVAFRDLERARWRAVQVLNVGSSVQLTAKLSDTNVFMDYKVVSSNSPGAPSLPEMPKAPEIKTPEMPKMPEMPKAPEIPKIPTFPSR
jgi:type VI secretion system protein VasD